MYMHQAVSAFYYNLLEFITEALKVCIHIVKMLKVSNMKISEAQLIKHHTVCFNQINPT